MKTPYESTLTAALTNGKNRQYKKMHLGRADAVTMFYNREGALGFTITLPDTDKSVVQFYRYGVNKHAPKKLYRSECLYSRCDNFDYNDWLIKTITDEFTECDSDLEDIIGTP
ncbi:hypothetical protein ACOZB2_27285 [Pantoea endophytica]|uniref:Uncharacterized protein n=1 Tax=Pantoea sp. BJ2 TaxID=3141322 RepID=A0AAU7U3G8_9GAMM